MRSATSIRLCGEGHADNSPSSRPSSSAWHTSTSSCGVVEASRCATQSALASMLAGVLRVSPQSEGAAVNASKAAGTIKIRSSSRAASRRIRSGIAVPRRRAKSGKASPSLFSGEIQPEKRGKRCGTHARRSRLKRHDSACNASASSVGGAPRLRSSSTKPIRRGSTSEHSTYATALGSGSGTGEPDSFGSHRQLGPRSASAEARRLVCRMSGKVEEHDDWAWSTRARQRGLSLRSTHVSASTPCSTLAYEPSRLPRERHMLAPVPAAPAAPPCLPLADGTRSRRSQAAAVGRAGERAGSWR
mmetsp:Transcript_55090/g.91297  ORF Transcript_55090/g.91297 Transcript_55090/m.91297 type:complete len:302 (-) Transcript_55090:52-957(-)